jgi:hypothetical protein
MHPQRIPFHPFHRFQPISAHFSPSQPISARFREAIGHVAGRLQRLPDVPDVAFFSIIYGHQAGIRGPKRHLTGLTQRHLTGLSAISRASAPSRGPQLQLAAAPAPTPTPDPRPDHHSVGRSDPRPLDLRPLQPTPALTRSALESAKDSTADDLIGHTC